MLRKLTAAVLLALVFPAAVMADGPVPVKMKGSDFKNFNAYEVDGTLYTAPVVLTKGGKWKLSWEKDKLYVELTPAAMKKEEKVEIPYKELEGNRYVNFSFFSREAGLSYTYKPEKKELTIKKVKDKKRKGRPLKGLWFSGTSTTPSAAKIPIFHPFPAPRSFRLPWEAIRTWKKIDTAGTLTTSKGPGRQI